MSNKQIEEAKRSLDKLRKEIEELKKGEFKGQWVGKIYRYRPDNYAISKVRNNTKQSNRR